VADLAPTEIMALGRIVDELDYYQLLHLEAGASAREVKRAYHATSRVFHPDANRHLDGELRSAVERIAKRVTEAYSVLRDPQRRAAYDRRLASGDGVRIQLAEAKAEAGRRNAEERLGRTPQGRQYFNLASADLKRGDYGAAVRNLQTALTFEPENAGFKRQLDDARRKLR
jgi:DnaJ-class molecular chaperone